MSEVPRITGVRLVVFLIASTVVIVGFSVMFYSMTNIQERQNALNNPYLVREERWSLEGSLKWWQQESASLYYPAAAILIVSGFVAILFVVLVR